MATVNTIKAAEIVADIRLGMLDTELMEKYQLSSKGLQIAFGKLVDGGALTQSEILNRGGLDVKSASFAQRRELPRNFLLFPVHICDSDDPDTAGYVVDVTEKGLQVSGIETEVGRSRKFLVQACEYYDVPQLAFEAQCRWAKTGENKEDFSSGYQITDLPNGTRKELQKLIQVLSFGTAKNPVEKEEDASSPPIVPEPSASRQKSADISEKSLPARPRRFAATARRSLLFVFVIVTASAAIGPVLTYTAGSGNDMALIEQSRKGVVDEVKVLLFHGADANAKTEKGSTSLMWASYNGHEKIARLLVKAGADVNAQDKLGNTPLTFAALRNHPKVVRFLLRAGADANLTDNNGLTALRWAAGKGHREITKILRPLTGNKETTLSMLP